MLACDVRAPLSVRLVDPSAFTLGYDHELGQALAKRGIDVNLDTSHYPFDAMPDGRLYRVNLHFYRYRLGPLGSRRQRAASLAQHGIDMVRLSRLARPNEVLHFQWFAFQQLDLLVHPRRNPIVFTAHDVVPREHHLGERLAQRKLLGVSDAVIVHYERGRQLLLDFGVPEEKVHVIPIGAYRHLADHPSPAQLPAELANVKCPVALFFGVIRSNKGLDVLLEAWRGTDDAELWVVGQPHIDVSQLVRAAPAGVRFITKWIKEEDIPPLFRRADLVVLPYREIDQSAVAFTALAFARPLLLSDAGGFPDIAAQGAARTVPAGDAPALHRALRDLLGDRAARDRLSEGARQAAAGPFSWDQIAARTEAVYRDISVTT